MLNKPYKLSYKWRDDASHACADGAGGHGVGAEDCGREFHGVDIGHAKRDADNHATKHGQGRHFPVLCLHTTFDLK